MSSLQASSQVTDRQAGGLDAVATLADFVAGTIRQAIEDIEAGSPLDARVRLEVSERACGTLADFARDLAGSRLPPLVMKSVREEKLVEFPSERIDDLREYMETHTQKDISDQLSCSQSVVSRHLGRIYHGDRRCQPWFVRGVLLILGSQNSTAGHDSSREAKAA